MSNNPFKMMESPNGKTYVLKPNQQTTAADIISLHNLIAQLLVDDYIDTQKINDTKKTTA